MQEGTYVGFECEIDSDDELVLYMPDNDSSTLQIECRQDSEIACIQLSGSDARELARRILEHVGPESDA